MNIDPREYQQIESMIQCSDSPVGIDAKKTHVYIIHLLHRIDQRLTELENRVRRAERAVPLAAKD